MHSPTPSISNTALNYISASIPVDNPEPILQTRMIDKNYREARPFVESMDPERSNRVRKRAPNACLRCRQQKIRCSGQLPCSQCTKRKLSCTFEDPSVKILVTKGYVNDLERRLANFERGQAHEPRVAPATIDPFEQGENDHARTELGNTSQLRVEGPGPQSNASRSAATSPEPQLVNHLASGLPPQFIADRRGRPIYMGTSSNWSFGRRILATAYEKILGESLPIDDLLFQGQVYELDWSGELLGPHQETNLPSSDFAIYLINAVKFHCGQIFHLFDEQKFMQDFAKHHAGQEPQRSHIWRVHYMLILALGKAFVVRVGKDSKPPGAEYFSQAMKCLPNLAFLFPDDLEVMEMLCCAALYLHSLDFRCAAYGLIGQALRLALEKGMNTDMRSRHIDDCLAQRCRKIWWTILVLDRQMSALMGVPMAVRDEDISAELPKSSVTQREALQLHITLSNLIAEIATGVYGSGGRLGKEYLINTKAVLKKIGDNTDRLNETFALTPIARLSAYLHLLHHQCVALATRPLFFDFFQMRLNAKDPTRCYVPRTGSVRALVNMGVESAQHIFKLLSALQTEGLLETFLPFDLDSVFTAITILQMAHAADNDLIESKGEWVQEAANILDEMIARGNLVARYFKSEMEQLDKLLARLPRTSRKDVHRRRPAQDTRPIAVTPTHPTEATELLGASIEQVMIEEIDWQNGFTTEHLFNMADSLDIDGLDWLSTTTMDMLT